MMTNNHPNRSRLVTKLLAEQSEMQKEIDRLRELVRRYQAVIHAREARIGLSDPVRA